MSILFGALKCVKRPCSGGLRGTGRAKRRCSLRTLRSGRPPPNRLSLPTRKCHTNLEKPRLNPAPPPLLRALLLPSRLSKASTTPPVSPKRRLPLRQSSLKSAVWRHLPPKPPSGGATGGASVGPLLPTRPRTASRAGSSRAGRAGPGPRRGASRPHRGRRPRTRRRLPRAPGALPWSPRGQMGRATSSASWAGAWAPGQGSPSHPEA